MKTCMLSAFRSNTDVARVGLLLVMGAATSSVWAQMLDGPGRQETEKLCSGCHELARSISLRQDRDGWKTTINKMIGLGAQGSEQEFAAVLEYLSTHYAAEALPPLNVNKAKAIDFEARLSLRRSQATAIIDYRMKHGDFKSIEELKKVPGVDVSKIEAKRDILEF